MTDALWRHYDKGMYSRVGVIESVQGAYRFGSAWAWNHWIGEHSLVASLLTAGLVQGLVGVCLAYLTVTVSNLMFAEESAALTYMAAAVTFHLLDLPVFVWWIVGAIRAAFRIGRKEKAWLFPGLCTIVAGGIFAGECYMLASSSIPQAIDAVQELRDDPEWPPTEMKMLGEDRLRITGYIRDSVARDFKMYLSMHRGIKTVLLDSLGGRLDPARKMESQIRLHHVDTEIDDECDSSCIIVFLGGTRRSIAETARMGFHKPTAVGDFDNDEVGAIVREEAQKGVSQDFLVETYQLSSQSVTYPNASELKQAGVVTDIIQSSR